MEGISFIVRVRNEEATLEECLRSLTKLTIPYDIHVILHLCTDRSLEIAEKIQSEGFPVHIHGYQYPVSRAGYEVLVTDKDSKHSMVEYSRWCISRSTRVWTFRWDSDFIASDALIDILNAKTWFKPDISTQYAIHYVSDDVSSSEKYLFSGEYEYIKYIFWEYCRLVGEVQTLSFPKEMYIRHNSVLTNKKAYWEEPCWFWPVLTDEAMILRTKYHALLSICGPEENAQARACNPVSNDILSNVVNKEEELKKVGIHFWS